MEEGLFKKKKSPKSRSKSASDGQPLQNKHCCLHSVLQCCVLNFVCWCVEWIAHMIPFIVLIVMLQ